MHYWADPEYQLMCTVFKGAPIKVELCDTWRLSSEHARERAWENITKTVTDMFRVINYDTPRDAFEFYALEVSGGYWSDEPQPQLGR